MKKEILELKRQFTMANCAITRITSAVFNEYGEWIQESIDTFLNLPEEQMFKYFDLFRKGLSGKKGKNLYSLEFQEPGTKEAMEALVVDKLTDRTQFEITVENIAECYQGKGKYAVFTIHAIYDIPGIAKDGTEMDDASDEVYEYTMTCICPVTLSKPGLSLKGENIDVADRQWMIGMPCEAFLYPAFTDRHTDWNHVWYYTSKPEDTEGKVIEHVLGCKRPSTPQEQRDAFYGSLNSSLHGKYNINQAKDLYNEMQVKALEEEEELTPEKILEIMRACGIDTEGAAVKDIAVSIQNVLNKNTFEVGLEDAHVTVAADRTDLVDLRNIDGETYVTVKAGGSVIANGLEIRRREDGNSRRD